MSGLQIPGKVEQGKFRPMNCTMTRRRPNTVVAKFVPRCGGGGGQQGSRLNVDGDKHSSIVFSIQLLLNLAVMLLGTIALRQSTESHIVSKTKVTIVDGGVEITAVGPLVVVIVKRKTW